MHLLWQHWSSPWTRKWPQWSWTRSRRLGVRRLSRPWHYKEREQQERQACARYVLELGRHDGGVFVVTVPSDKKAIAQPRPNCQEPWREHAVRDCEHRQRTRTIVRTRRLLLPERKRSCWSASLTGGEFRSQVVGDAKIA